MEGSGVAISPVIKKYRALQQNKANLEEAIQRNEGYRGIFDIIGDDDFDVENAKRSLAIINAKLQKVNSLSLTYILKNEETSKTCGKKQRE